MEDGAVEEAGDGAARAAGLRPRARALRGALPAAGRPEAQPRLGQPAPRALEWESATNLNGNPNLSCSNLVFMIDLEI